MSKLSKKQAALIAELVNSIQSAEVMQSEMNKQGRHDRWEAWHRDQCKATVKLADEHGIELPTLQMCRDWLDVDWLREQRKAAA